MRLDKLLALQGLGSRSEVRALLRAGRVRVDGRLATDGAMHVDEKAAAVLLDGEALAYEASLHLMLNKPAGVVTAAKDERHPTVLSLLPKKAAAMGCMPVGRLDLDTEGLLLCTTDGALAHRLLSPKRHVDKRYHATLDLPLDDADVQAFAHGIALSDFTAMPASLEILADGHAAIVTVQEGKFHQVKRMFAARGKQVLSLRRIAFAGIALDETLAPGAWRRLTGAEHARLLEAAGGQHG